MWNRHQPITNFFFSSKANLVKPLVKISARCRSVETLTISISFGLILDLNQCYLIPICFVRDVINGPLLFAKFRVPTLSSHALDTVKVPSKSRFTRDPIFSTQLRDATNSLMHWDSAIYSNSRVDKAISDCNLELQNIGTPQKSITNPSDFWLPLDHVYLQLQRDLQSQHLQTSPALNALSWGSVLSLYLLFLADIELCAWVLPRVNVGDYERNEHIDELRMQYPGVYYQPDTASFRLLTCTPIVLYTNPNLHTSLTVVCQQGWNLGCSNITPLTLKYGQSNLFVWVPLYPLCFCQFVDPKTQPCFPFFLKKLILEVVNQFVYVCICLRVKDTIIYPKQTIMSPLVNRKLS